MQIGRLIHFLLTHDWIFILMGLIGCLGYVFLSR